MTEWVQDVLGDGGYLVLFAMLVLENLFPPIPSEIVLPFAGALVAEGGLVYVAAVLTATAGSLAGALILYAVGRYGGRPLLYRYNRLFRVTDEQLDRADAWFDRRGPLLVLLGRLVPTVRSVVSIPAGAAEMPVGQFVLLTALGSVVWNAALIGAGWALSSNWEQAAAVVEQFKTVVYVVVVLAVAAGLVWLVRRRRRTRAASA